MNVLTVYRLTRRFGNLTVLDDVSFTVAEAETTIIMGPNGSGKSTLLRCVMGSDRCDAGEVSIYGRRADETDPWIRSIVAAVLDDMDFFPDLSVVEHLRLLAYAHGNGGDDVEEVLAEVDLDKARDQLPVTLSSGQRHRLGLASCLVRPRRLLVLDEPEQRLDVRGRVWLADRLRREKDSGVTVLMASHDPVLIDAVADTRIRIDG